MQLSVQHNKKIFFVTKSGQNVDASKDLNCSYELIANFASSKTHLEWISKDNCVLLPSTLIEHNIFVLEKFQGPTFKHLFRLKATILGPQFILMCQLTNDIVPDIESPIFTLAMKNVVASLSEITASRRSSIRKMIKYMGGSLTEYITKSTTHLITNATSSAEYEMPAMSNIKIMKEEWVFEMWKLSNGDTSYTSEELDHKYQTKIPIFKNLAFTSIGLSEVDTNEVIKLIENNGGIYIERKEIELIKNISPLKSKAIDIFLQPDKKNTKEFKAVAECCKEYLKVDWVRSSVSKGQIEPYDDYRIYTGQRNESADFHNDKIQSSKAKSDSPIENIPFVITSRAQAISGAIGWRDKKKLRFSIHLKSYIHNTRQQVLKEQIIQLKGEICDESSILDPSSTHVICYKPDRSEKVLSAIASGRWLLCPAYIEDSARAGHFLNEEYYEWGNPKAQTKLPNVSDNYQMIAMSSHKKRKDLQLKYESKNKPVGIFSGFRVILQADDDKFKRVLEAGCAIVVNINNPKEFHGATHCFLLSKNKDLSNHQKQALEEADVPCVDILHLEKFFI